MASGSIATPSFRPQLTITPPDPLQECTESGWQHVQVDIGGQQRQLLAKGNSLAFRGVILLLHGGGGNFTDWCSQTKSYAMWQFAQEVIEQGYAVIALDSTHDRLVDEWGQNCGKRFDTATPVEENTDLPFVSWILDDLIPTQRPQSEYSSENVFVVGLSNGGFMTTRIATYFDDRITAFVPVSAGDPYGTLLNCDNTLGLVPEAPGGLIDRETGLSITLADACSSPSYLNEMTWDTANPVTKPHYMLAYHADDGLVNNSCMEKLNRQLADHGYLDAGALILTGGGLDPQTAHYWRPEYNQAIIDFFNGFGLPPGC